VVVEQAVLITEALVAVASEALEVAVRLAVLLEQLTGVVVVVVAVLVAQQLEALAAQVL
jgi:hypothetical protein